MRHAECDHARCWPWPVCQFRHIGSARWRTTDEGELARALQVDKPAAQVDGQTSLLDLIEEGA